MMDRLKSKTRCRAFSLIELLVVISIVSVLMAIIVPVLGRAKKDARRMVCAGNLEQIGAAMKCYAHDYDDYIITAREMFFALSLPEAMSVWHVVLAPYVGHKDIRNLLGDSRPRIWRCPADKDPYPIGYKGYPHKREMTSYALNGYYRVETEELQALQLGPGGTRKFSEITHPTACMLIAETSYCSQIYDAEHPAAAEANVRDDGHYRSTSGFYHNNSMNVLFVDGHIESIKGKKDNQLVWPRGFEPQYKSGRYMYWPELTLPSAKEDPAFWGPGY